MFRSCSPHVPGDDALPLLPRVAARVGGNGELIEPDVTGTLCEAPAPDALTAAIRRYLDDRPLREAHGAAARARCVAHFSMGAMVLGYTELYDELLARNP